MSFSEEFPFGPLPSYNQMQAQLGVGKDPQCNALAWPTSLHFHILKCAVKKYSGLLQDRRRVLFLMLEELFRPISVSVPSGSLTGEQVIFHPE